MFEGKKVQLVYESLLFNQEWEEEATVTLQECSKCGKKRAYATNIRNEKKEINPMLISRFA
jgi:Zn ribbon nucleic-acid-binding protein